MEDNPDALEGFTVDELQNTRMHGVSPFMFAIKNGLNRVVAYMIDHGVDLNAPTAKYTPIKMAIAAENDEAFKLLIQHGASVDTTMFSTLFHNLSLNPNSVGLREMLRTVLAIPGMVIPSDTPTGKSLLYEAFRYDLDDETIQLLVQTGVTSTPANLNVKQKSNNVVTKRISEMRTQTAAEKFGASLFVNAAYMDIPWLRRQIAYIHGLNNADKIILAAYTYLGDTFLNAFLRGMFDAPKFLSAMRREPLTGAFHTYILMRRGLTLESVRRGEFMEDLERNYVAYLEAYRDDLQRVITSAPRPSRAIKVFRGIKHAEYMIAELERSDLFETQDFQSTSLSDMRAVDFSRYHEMFGKYKYGTVMEIVLDELTPCLFMEPVSKFDQEMEILLPMGLRFKHSQTLVKRVDTVSRPSRTFKIQVIEMEGVPV